MCYRSRSREHSQVLEIVTWDQVHCETHFELNPGSDQPDSRYYSVYRGASYVPKIQDIVCNVNRGTAELEARYSGGMSGSVYQSLRYWTWRLNAS